MIGCVLQARMGSTRLPGKVLLPLGGKPSIVRVLERASQISGIDRIVVATTTLRQDLQLVDAVRSTGYEAIMPTATPDNVLSRYYWTAKQLKFDTIVRITGDCPLLDPAVSSRVVGVFESKRWDYVSNRRPATFPDGFDTEILDFDTLERAYKQAKDLYSREHVTPYIYQSKEFTVQNVWNTKDQSMIRLTLDTHEDYDYIKYVYDTLGDNPQTKDILELPRQRIVDRV